MLQYKNVGFELKQASADGGEFEGYAAVFGNIDRTGDIILPGAFKDTLPQFLKDGIIAWQHDWSTPIGRPLECYEDSKGLYIKASLIDTQAGMDARKLLLAGIVKKMSIGYSVIDGEWLDADNIEAYLTDEAATMRDIASAMYWGRALKKIELYEVSPVSIPANTQADIVGAKGLRDGLSFPDHSQTVLAAVQEYAERMEGLKSLRAKDGRGLGAKRQEDLDRIAGDLEKTLATLKSLRGQDTEPASAPVTLPADANAAFLRFLECEAQLPSME